MNLKAIISDENYKSPWWKARECLQELVIAEGPARAELLAAAQVYAILEVARVIEEHE